MWRWPTDARRRRLRFEPLHPIVVRAAQADPQLAERLVLVDALRGSDGARVTALASKLLQDALRT